MALQENSSEINTSTASRKKFLPKIFLFVLKVSCDVAELTVASSLMDYLLDSLEENGQDQRIAIIVGNLYDGVSSICVVIVSQISEAYTGCFTMIVICVAATVQVQMEIPVPRVRLQMDCLEGSWESLGGNRRCQFCGTMRFVMTSLAHPEIPARIIEACIEWEQPTPAQYKRFALAPVVEILSDSDEHDPVVEEDPKEDPEEEPEEEDPEEEIAEEPVPSPGDDGPLVGGQQPWLMGSTNESSHEFELEWMASHHAQWRANWTAPPANVDDLPSVASSSERSEVPESSGSGSCTAVVDVDADSSSERDSYSSSSESDE